MLGVQRGRKKTCEKWTHTPYWPEPPIAAREMKVSSGETKGAGGLERGGAPVVGGAKALPPSVGRVISVRRETEREAGGVAGREPRGGLPWSQAAGEPRSGMVSVTPSWGRARGSWPLPSDVGVPARGGTERGVVAWETARAGGRREGGISGALSERKESPGGGGGTSCSYLRAFCQSNLFTYFPLGWRWG